MARLFETPTTTTTVPSPSTGTTVPQSASDFSETPPVAGAGGGTSPSDSGATGQYGLDASFDYPARNVSLPKIKVGNEPGYEKQFFGETSRTVYDKGYTATGSEDWVYNATYVGPLLVDATGQIAREQYDLDISSGDVWPTIASFTEGPVREAFLKTLYAKGLYSYGEPSKFGTSDADFNAVQQFLLVANTWGYTADVALNLLNQKYPNMNIPNSSGSARPIQYTAAKDLEAVMRSTSQQILGRTVSDEDVKRFVDAYHASEAAAQRGSRENAPAMDVAAQSQIEQQYGAEASAVGFTNLASIMESLIRGA